MDTPANSRDACLTLRCMQLGHALWKTISGSYSTLSSPVSRSTSLNIVIACLWPS